jgi:hypothetical protein
MPRPRKYASVAEKHRAYRLRKKLKENEHPPELDRLAKMVHKIYKERGRIGLIDPEKFVGKTPYETLLRVVVYDLLFLQHLPDDTAEFEYPPLDKLIIPSLGISPDLPAWEIRPNRLTDESEEYVWRYVEPEDQGIEEDNRQKEV